jgi:hypothetical protein
MESNGTSKDKTSKENRKGKQLTFEELEVHRPSQISSLPDDSLEHDDHGRRKTSRPKVGILFYFPLCLVQKSCIFHYLK